MKKTPRRKIRRGILFLLSDQFDYGRFRAVAAALTEKVNPRIAAALLRLFLSRRILGCDFVEEFIHQRVLNVGRPRLVRALLFGKALDLLKIVGLGHDRAAGGKLLGAVLDVGRLEFLAFFIRFRHFEFDIVVVGIDGFGDQFLNIGSQFLGFCGRGFDFTVPKELGCLIS